MSEANVESSYSKLCPIHYSTLRFRDIIPSMAFIEELESLSDRAQAGRGLLAVRIRRVFKHNSDKIESIRCQICEEWYYPPKKYWKHLPMCKKLHRAVQDDNRQNCREMERAVERFRDIDREMAKRNGIYSQYNISSASGIGESVHMCTTWVGFNVLRIIELGQVPLKMSALTHLFKNLERERGNAAVKTLFRIPDANLISAFNDLLVLIWYSHFQ